MGGSAEATCPRGGESRQRLIGAGTELFAARGFTATSVRDIIAAAGWPNWAAVG